MYNLFVSGFAEDWQGAPWQIDLSRCVREHTEPELTKRFGELDAAAIAELKRLPCIFAYETYNKLAPKFGVIRDVVKRLDQVRVEYALHPIAPFLTAADMEQLTFELGIGKLEMNRTHWAVKDIDLFKELAAKGIMLPAWARPGRRIVDISTHQFEVALSFPGETRGLVKQVADDLERRLGADACFYDNNYTAQLARPSLDTLLQDIYRKRSKLIVVFVGSDYQRKEWCGIELRAIREIILERGYGRIMFVRLDDGEVEWIFKTDGYVDSQRHSAAEIASFIHERVQILN